jgi:hypothetical protein
MTTSGTSVFNPEIADLFTESWERIGKARDSMSGDLARSGRASLSYLFVEWQTRDVNLWAIDLQSVPMVATTATYNAVAGTVAILDAFIRRGTTDYALTPLGRSEYDTLSDKTTPGRPTQFWYERIASPIIHLWPVPDLSTDVLWYHRIRRLQDVTAGSETADVVYLWLEAMAAGLAVRFAEKWAPERLQEKIGLANEKFGLALGTDRERATFSMIPNLSGYRVV